MFRSHKMTKVALLIGLALFVAFFAAHYIVFAVYRAKFEKELALLEAEAAREGLDVTFQPPSAAAKAPSAFDWLLDYSPPFDDMHRSRWFEYSDTSVPDDMKIAWALDEYSRWQTRSFRWPPVPSASPAADTWRDEWLPLLAAHVEENKAFLDGAKEAARQGAPPFSVDWASWQNTEDLLSKSSNAVWYLSRLISADGIIKARSGDIHGAMEDALLTLRFRRLFDRYPSVLFHTARVVDDVTFGLIQAILDCGQPSRADVDAVMDELAARDDLNSLVRPFIIEAVAGFERFEAARKDPWSISRTYQRFWSGYDPPTTRDRLLRRAIDAFYRVFWVVPADKYYFTVSIRRLIDRARLPYPDRLDGPSSVEMTSEYPPGLSFMTFPCIAWRDGMLTHAARADAQARMARTVLAISLYKADSGGYPDSLDAIVPAYLPSLEIDPFDGKSLRYRRTPSGYVVYSVYTDRTDNGGDYPDDWTWEHDDRPRSVAKPPE